MSKYFDQTPYKEQKNFYIPSEEFLFENQINSPLRENNSEEFFFDNENTENNISTSENTELDNQFSKQRKFQFITEKDLKNSKKADYISKKIFKIYKDYELELIEKLCEKYDIKKTKLPFNRFFINHYKCILTITLNFVFTHQNYDSESYYDEKKKKKINNFLKHLKIKCQNEISYVYEVTIRERIKEIINTKKFLQKIEDYNTKTGEKEIQNIDLIWFKKKFDL